MPSKSIIKILNNKQLPNIHYHIRYFFATLKKNTYLCTPNLGEMDQNK